MGAVGSILIVGMTVLLVMFIAAVITSHPEDDVRPEPPALQPVVPSPVVPVVPVVPAGWSVPAAPPVAAADLVGDFADPALHDDAQLVLPNGTHPPQVRGGPPWAPAPKPPGLPY